MCIQIKKLVLEEGYCYRDIAVVAGDLETYADYFEREASCVYGQDPGAAVKPFY